ncbi:hypothetical protein DSL92_06995 [Billgrantia gudaonensis]|uniref:Uncharacterized protein n=1 Tax=Billgrantia gudaonensis TaxID=376427 RepID=A0A432JI88_9GAMM|nr:hypothetical protein DSL92_06995 [Halomonas gudaonensis]
MVIINHRGRELARIDQREGALALAPPGILTRVVFSMAVPSLHQGGLAVARGPPAKLMAHDVGRRGQKLAPEYRWTATSILTARVHAPRLSRLRHRFPRR